MPRTVRTRRGAASAAAAGGSAPSPGGRGDRTRRAGHRPAPDQLPAARTTAGAAQERAVVETHPRRRARRRARRRPRGGRCTSTPEVTAASRSASTSMRLCTWWSAATHTAPRTAGDTAGSSRHAAASRAPLHLEPELALEGVQLLDPGPVAVVGGDDEGAGGVVADGPAHRRRRDRRRRRATARRRQGQGEEGLLAVVDLAHRGEHPRRRPRGPTTGRGVDHGHRHAPARPLARRRRGRCAPATTTAS